MKVSEHIGYSTCVSVLIAPAFGWNTLYFLGASLLIDLDHYFHYVYFTDFKNWSIKKMFKYHDLIPKYYVPSELLILHAFHTVEFFMCIYTLALYFKSMELMLVICGLIFHFSLDLIRLKTYKAIDTRVFTFYEYIIRRGALMKIGHDNEAVYKLTAQWVLGNESEN